MISLLGIGLLFATLRGTALHSADLVVFATLGDSVTLPCDVSSGSLCSTVSWTKGWFGPKVLKEGQREALNMTLLEDCSLRLSYMETSSASIYTCVNGNKTLSADLQYVQITENKSTGEIELECYINNHIGLINPCNKTGLKVHWLTQGNAPLKGERFQIQNKGSCFSKLKIQSKKTDHNRQWKCQVSVNGSAKATASYQTTVTDGIEEVFSVVSESVFLTCTNISSLALIEKGQTPTSISKTGSTTIITDVTASNSGEYHCEDKGQAKTIWLHTVDIISEMDLKGENVTLSCVLTCANTTCDKDFNLTWSVDNALYMTSGLLEGNRSLINKLSVSVFHLGPGDTVCSVLRDGVQVATKKWHYSNSLHGLVWIALPIALLCVAAIVVWDRKRKRNKNPENQQANIGLTEIYYENVQNYGPERRREAVTSNDSFYNLLQAVD